MTETMRQTTYLPLILAFALQLPNLFAQSATAIPASAPAAKDAPYTYQILYTGRTLGYARIPDQQTLPQDPLPVPNKIAQEFLEQFKIASDSKVPQFRVAMGDNFSPDLYGRSILVRSPRVRSCDEHRDDFYSAAIHLPKDYFNYNVVDGKGYWSTWCQQEIHLSDEPFFDNVADFLIKAQYTAVVPGKHDFYFGPQYLRQIANYLEHSHFPDSPEHVHMLAENLIISSTVAPGPLNAHPRIPERLAQPCHYNTGNDHACYHTDFGPASLDLPDNVLPWKRQFVLHGARRAAILDPTLAKENEHLFRKDELKNFMDIAVHYTNVFEYTNPKTHAGANSISICAEKGDATDGDPAKAAGNPCSHLMPLIASSDACTDPVPSHLISACKSIYATSNGLYDPKKQAASTDITFLFANPQDHLIAGLNHMFCVFPSKEFSETFHDLTHEICQPFPVQIPMFWSNPNIPQPAPGMVSCEAEPSIPCPYALVPSGPADHQVKVAIFAVVDPDLLSNVGMLNASWLNNNKRWDTAAQVTAPDYALLQTLELCNASQACREAPKILLAQMSYARATQLISNSNFNNVFAAVITQASSEHDTGINETKYQGSTPRFALTPPLPISAVTITDDKRTQSAVFNGGRPLAGSVFVPQVYVATIKRESSPTIDPANPAAGPSRPPTSACRPSPPDSYTPPPVISLSSSPKWPSNQPPNWHNFGPCWTLQNASARWNAFANPSSASLSRDLPKYLVSPTKDFCSGEDEAKRKCLDLKHLAERYLGRLNQNAQAQPITKPAASNPLTQAVLVAMRDALKTDAAMIQSRDLYDADNLSMEKLDPSEVQDQISRVVWKGDEAIVLHVTGATIRKLLKQSATFGQLDLNALNTEIESGRDLVTLGIYANPKDSDTYYINGSIMSDTALYTIATTDFISGGDTGYSNLVPPDVLPALRIRDFAHRQARPIAGLVCKSLVTQPNPKTAGLDLPCADMQIDPEYFEDTKFSPNDATPGFSTRQRWAGFFRTFLPPRRPFPDSEESVQQHPFWTVKLENLDFSESGAFVNHFSKTVPSLYGISNPLISNTNTQTLGADYKARGIYDHKAWTYYALSDMSFLNSNIVSYSPATATVTNGPPALTYNLIGFESGATMRLSRNRNVIGVKQYSTPMLSRPSWFSAQASIRYEKPLVSPVNTQVTAAAPTTPQPSVQYVSNIIFKTPSINTLYGRIGVRAENGDAYLEAGYEKIDARNLLQSYKISQTGGQTYFCFPSANLPIGCGTNNDSKNPNPGGAPLQPAMLTLTGQPNLQVMPAVASYLTGGFYFNFYWKFPIWSRRDANRVDQSWYFTLTNKGDFYTDNHGSDTSVQTRYLDKFTPAFNLPIWAGLSLTPKVDLILYQDKVLRYHYLAIQPGFSLSYTFTKREGMNWLRAAKYGAQTTTASPAGTTH